MWIKMPTPRTSTGALDPTGTAINVSITGWHAFPPAVAADLPTSFMVGRAPTGGASFSLVNPRHPVTDPRYDVDPTDPIVVGEGPLNIIRWDYALIRQPVPPGNPGDRWPEGLRLDANTGVIRGQPTEAGTFTFNIALTLPGTMRILYGPPPTEYYVENPDPYSIVVAPFRVNFGDVDRDGSVTLRDLVLLARALDVSDPGVTLNDIDQEAARVAPGNPPGEPRTGPPGPADLFELASWFSRQQQ
jgi:hypothetical protein